MRLLKSFALAAIVMGLTGPACAEISAREFLDAYDKADVKGRADDLVMLYALEGGLGWANTYLDAHHQPLIYCEPKDRALSAEDDLRIVRTMTDKAPAMAKFEVGMVLMQALHDIYPCPAH